MGINAGKYISPMDPMGLVVGNPLHGSSYKDRSFFGRLDFQGQ